MLNQRFMATLGTLILATGLVWLWQWYDYRAYVRAEQEDDQRYGDVILAGAAGAMHRQCRFRTPDLELLNNTLEDGRARVEATYLGIFQADGKPYVTAGKSADGVTRRVRKFSFPAVHGNCRLKTGEKSDGIKPGCAGCTLPGGTMEIRLEYPADRLEKRIDRAWFRFLAVGGAFTLAFGSLFLFFQSRMRAADLHARLAAKTEQVRSLEFLGRLGAGLAHETKNPLGSVRGFAELLLRKELTGEDVREAAGRIVDETDRIVTRLDEFMLLSRPVRPRMAVFPLKDLLEDLAGLVRLELAGKEARLEVKGDGVVVKADREQVRRLFMNLLVNAAEAVDQGGRIEVEIHGDEERKVRVVVEDDGVGIPEALRDTMFEPYVTGKAEGTGLGLAIARRIAAEHGWQIRYEPGRNKGTRIIVEGPAA